MLNLGRPRCLGYTDQASCLTMTSKLPDFFVIPADQVLVGMDGSICKQSERVIGRTGKEVHVCEEKLEGVWGTEFGGITPHFHHADTKGRQEEPGMDKSKRERYTGREEVEKETASDGFPPLKVMPNGGTLPILFSS